MGAVRAGVGVTWRRWHQDRRSEKPSDLEWEMVSGVGAVGAGVGAVRAVGAGIRLGVGAGMGAGDGLGVEWDQA